MATHDSTTNVFLKTKDFLVSQEEFDLVWNEQRDMLITSPSPPQAKLGLYYKSEAYISHTDASKSLVEKVYQKVKRHSIKRKVRLLTQKTKGTKSVLDIGAGTGDFLQFAKTKGWNISGIETNPDAIARASEKQVELTTEVATLKGNTYGAITLWHVLEHLPNPEDRLAEYYNLLEDDGVLIVAVPNFKSWDAQHYKNFWAAYDVPRHLYHFSQKSIERLASNKFKVESIRPMIFDSFYVSLLSEKYKKSTAPLFKGFINGLRSNLVASSSKEYSSLIYVLRKRN